MHHFQILDPEIKEMKKSILEYRNCQKAVLADILGPEIAAVLERIFMENTTEDSKFVFI